MIFKILEYIVRKKTNFEKVVESQLNIKIHSDTFLTNLKGSSVQIKVYSLHLQQTLIHTNFKYLFFK